MVNSVFSADLISELYSLSSFTDQLVVYVKGIVTRLDQPMHPYIFDHASMAIDDGYNVVRPTAILATDPKRWIRMPNLPVSLSYSKSLTLRPLNTVFTPSVTSASIVNYTVKFTQSLTATGNLVASVSLQTSLDGGVTWITEDQVGQDLSATITLLTISNGGTYTLSGTILPNQQVKLLTSGTGITAVKSSELYIN